MTASALPPVRRLHYASTDVDEGTEFMRDAFTHYEPDLAGDPREFAVDLCSEAVDTSSGTIRLDRVRHSMTMSADAEPFDQPVIVAVLGGRYAVSSGQQDASSVGLLPSWDRFHSESQDFDVLCCTLDLLGARRVAADLSGLDAASVTFTGVAPTSSARATALARTMIHVQRHVFTDDDALTHPLALAETFRHLATMMVLAFPNTALDAVLDPAVPSAGRADPATVRRAAEFIDANARRDIDITEIAEAARIGPRGLQAAFRKHRGQTPLEYLRRVRLEGAHRDLKAADPTRGSTVGAVAASWGFAHPGRFSVDYRHAYGCSPSATLRG